MPVCAALFPKTSSPEHFALALQILLAGGSSVPAEILLDRPSGNNAAIKPWLTNMTERERQVLKGVTQGCSNKEIARQMEVAEVTVKLHLRNVFRKMDVKSRAEAAVKAVKSASADPIPSYSPIIRLEAGNRQPHGIWTPSRGELHAKRGES